MSDNNNGGDRAFEERVQTAVSAELRKISAERAEMEKSFEARERERAREQQALIHKMQAHMAALSAGAESRAPKAAVRRAMSDDEIDRELSKAAGDDAWRGMPRMRLRIPMADKRDPVQEVGINGRFFLLRRGDDIEVPMPLYLVLRGAGIA